MEVDDILGALEADSLEVVDHILAVVASSQAVVPEVRKVACIAETAGTGSVGHQIVAVDHSLDHPAAVAGDSHTVVAQEEGPEGDSSQTSGEFQIDVLAMFCGGCYEC